MKKIILILTLISLTAFNAYADNRALDFGGEVVVPDSDDWAFGTGDFTIEGWLQFRNYQYLPHPIVDQGTRVSGYSSTWSLVAGTQNTSSGVIAFASSNTSTGTAVYTGSQVLPPINSLNTWYHVAMVRDGLDWHYYCDGIDYGGYVAVNGAVANHTGNLVLGSMIDHEFMFNGLMDEVRIWGVARTQQQIQDWMNYELFGDEPGLIAYWNFNEGSGQTLYDRSGNGHNGQLGSTALADIYDPQWTGGAPVTAIPEPSTMLLFGFSLLGAGLIRRKGVK